MLESNSGLILLMAGKIYTQSSVVLSLQQPEIWQIKCLLLIFLCLACFGALPTGAIKMIECFFLNV